MESESFLPCPGLPTPSFPLQVKTLTRPTRAHWCP